MLSKIFILRHAETKIDSTIQSSNWGLTEAGMKSARTLAETGVFDEIDAIYSSPELKAIATANPFSVRLDLEITEDSDLSELNRGTTLIPSKEEYLERVRDALSLPPRPIRNWELSKAALGRFGNAITKIMEKHSCSLVVSHGLVMSLYFANCLGQGHNTFERWKLLGFLSWGIVSDSRVLKDII